MRSRLAATLSLLGSSLLLALLGQTVPVHGNSMPVSTPSGIAISTRTGSSLAWNRRAAAHALDDREAWWQKWQPAQRDHGTICISCHTVVPYAMARPGLRDSLGERGMVPAEKVMMANVEKRVNHWSAMVPFYSDAEEGAGKTAESHATEAVMNAVILASYDAAGNGGVERHLRPVTRTALNAAWALQQKDGGWQWQDFHLAPWESSESAYQGAALLYLEALQAPDGYAHEANAKRHLDLARSYLQQHYATQPMLNQLYVLWGDSFKPGLLTSRSRDRLLAALAALQQSDGGWRTSALEAAERSDHSPEPVQSDGYATALVELATADSDAGSQRTMRQQALAWLTAHQQKDGTWAGYSLNKKREPGSDPELFMSDAATGYAALALEQAR